MRQVLPVLFVSLLIACASASTGVKNSDGSLRDLPFQPLEIPGKALVFTYQDFGPPSLAHELCGDDWYRWSAPGSFAADDRFDVRVVVYSGLPEWLVETLYPSVPGLSDFRLIPRRTAERWLDASLADLDSRELPDLVSTLRATAARLR